MIEVIMAANDGKINCYTCKHFYVTWDTKHPRGCRVMGFESKEVPSLVVFHSSGIACTRFEHKKRSSVARD